MDRWEYKKIDFPHGGYNLPDREFEQLNAYGKQGWELVSMLNSSGTTLGAVMKRKITESPSQNIQQSQQSQQRPSFSDDDYRLSY